MYSTSTVYDWSCNSTKRLYSVQFFDFFCYFLYSPWKLEIWSFGENTESQVLKSYEIIYFRLATHFHVAILWIQSFINAYMIPMISAVRIFAKKWVSQLVIDVGKWSPQNFTFDIWHSSIICQLLEYFIFPNYFHAIHKI